MLIHFSNANSRNPHTENPQNDIKLKVFNFERKSGKQFLKCIKAFYNTLMKGKKKSKTIAQLTKFVCQCIHLQEIKQPVCNTVVSMF